jgi:ubiquitin conjugation factor E4 B
MLVQDAKAEVENTGMASQFYDKFNIRYNITQILKSVWHDRVHIEALVEISRNIDFFVKFVALLRNDTTYLLDEALSKLKTIGNLKTELMGNPPNKQELEQNLAQAERQALSCMSLGNETVAMLQYLTGRRELQDPFMANEIVDQLASMLDFNLVELVGPRCTELKVSNPQQYRFNPKKLLQQLMLIFVNLSQRSEFIQAVKKDTRSFKKNNFVRATQILEQNNLFTNVSWC